MRSASARLTTLSAMGGKRMVASVLAIVMALVALVAFATVDDRGSDVPAAGPERTLAAPAPDDQDASPVASTPTATPRPTRTKATPASLPGGGRKVFGRNRFLVAYYGTPGTGVLGVLGEQPPKRMHRDLVRAGRPFVRKGERLVPVYELIVTVADPHPGRGGDYNHDVARRDVRRYIEAAERRGALVVLDLQPGRDDFLTVAKRWKWALERPHVGLALDPEWRMGRHQVPGRVIGSVRAREVNRVSAWLNRLTDRQGLPEKVFMLHQFRDSMIVNPRRLVDRPHLAEVLHVDGFGTPGQKLDTYGALARPRQFRMGFKLFLDEDVPRMRSGAVRRIRPEVRFVSFQ